MSLMIRQYNQLHCNLYIHTHLGVQLMMYRCIYRCIHRYDIVHGPQPLDIPHELRISVFAHIPLCIADDREREPRVASTTRRDI